jgi:hypothetical protein
VECLEDRLHGFGVSQWNRSEFPLRATCINPNLWVLEQVPVPLRLGTKHRQKVNGLAFLARTRQESSLSSWTFFRSR